MASSPRRTTVFRGWIALATSTKKGFLMAMPTTSLLPSTALCSVHAHTSMRSNWAGHGDTPAVVITNRELPSTRKSVEFYSGDLKKLVDEILALRYGNIWLALAVEDRVHRPVALLRSAWDHLIPLFCYTDADGTARYRRSSRWQPGFGQGGDLPAGIERGCGAGPAQSRAPDCRGTRFPPTLPTSAP